MLLAASVGPLPVWELDPPLSEKLSLTLTVPPVGPFSFANASVSTDSSPPTLERLVRSGSTMPLTEWLIDMVIMPGGSGTETVPLTKDALAVPLKAATSFMRVLT